eukprot:5742912-Heterocapsa_arctica.AAC.1
MEPLLAVPHPPDVQILQRVGKVEDPPTHVKASDDLQVPHGVDLLPLLPRGLPEDLHLYVEARAVDARAVLQPHLAPELVEVQLDAALLVVLPDEAAEEHVL